MLAQPVSSATIAGHFLKAGGHRRIPDKMRSSTFHLFTTKETPADAEIASHQLMIRSGMIRKLGAGLYSWTPLGWRILRKVEQIVREEMDRAGCLEMIMPAVQPAELWQETGRWDVFGPQLLKMTDRAERDFCFGPTHEEVITDFARAEIRSYKQLPLCFYQIQTKFRDEIRPRFGVMRAREFVMKDAYSFHVDQASLAETYQIMHGAYSNAFRRMDLEFRAVQADSGAIGGAVSHEFQVMAASGEDAIAYASDSDYAANIERAEALAPAGERAEPGAAMDTVATADAKTIADVSQALDLPAERCVKTLIVQNGEDDLFAIVLRGDHSLNEVKLAKLSQFASGLSMADEAIVAKRLGCGVGSLGPVAMPLPLLVDRAAAHLSDFCCGANRDGFHHINVNWDRDLALGQVEDLRHVVAGDLSPDGGGTLEIARGIEVGHIFQLGDKYSQSMKATVQDENGKSVAMIMGCYGIGVTRIVAAAIEQNHDDRGIIWPLPLAPWQIAILPMNGHKSHRVREAAESLYQQLSELGYEVLLDDRKIRPGVMFAEMELIGIPHQVVIGERGLDDGEVEYKPRVTGQVEKLPWDGLAQALQAKLN